MRSSEGGDWDKFDFHKLQYANEIITNFESDKVEKRLYSLFNADVVSVVFTCHCDLIAKSICVKSAAGGWPILMQGQAIKYCFLDINSEFKTKSEYKTCRLTEKEHGTNFLGYRLIENKNNICLYLTINGQACAKTIRLRVHRHIETVIL